eukprot:2807025-Pleurochrysis_carterae.AAC.2
MRWSSSRSCRSLQNHIHHGPSSVPAATAPLKIVKLRSAATFVTSAGRQIDLDLCCSICHCVHHAKSLQKSPQTCKLLKEQEMETRWRAKIASDRTEAKRLVPCEINSVRQDKYKKREQKGKQTQSHCDCSKVKPAYPPRRTLKHAYTQRCSTKHSTFSNRTTRPKENRGATVPDKAAHASLATAPSRHLAAGTPQAVATIVEASWSASCTPFLVPWPVESTHTAPTCAARARVSHQVSQESPSLEWGRPASVRALLSRLRDRDKRPGQSSRLRKTNEALSAILCRLLQLPWAPAHQTPNNKRVSRLSELGEAAKRSRNTKENKKLREKNETQKTTLRIAGREADGREESIPY